MGGRIGSFCTTKVHLDAYNVDRTMHADAQLRRSELFAQQEASGLTCGIFSGPL